MCCSRNSAKSWCEDSRKVKAANRPKKISCKFARRISTKSKLLSCERRKNEAPSLTCGAGKNKRNQRCGQMRSAGFRRGAYTWVTVESTDIGDGDLAYRKTACGGAPFGRWSGAVRRASAEPRSGTARRVGRDFRLMRPASWTQAAWIGVHQ